MVSTVAESRSLGRAKAGLVAMAAVAAGTAIFDLAARPRGGTETLVSVADYVFTALLIPFVLAPLAALAALRSAQQGRDGRLGTVGFVVTAIGLAAFLPCGILTLATGDATSGGPLYPLAMAQAPLPYLLRRCRTYGEVSGSAW